MNETCSYCRYKTHIFFSVSTVKTADRCIHYSISFSSKHWKKSNLNRKMYHIVNVFNVLICSKKYGMQCCLPLVSLPNCSVFCMCTLLYICFLHCVDVQCISCVNSRFISFCKWPLSVFSRFLNLI